MKIAKVFERTKGLELVIWLERHAIKPFEIMHRNYKMKWTDYSTSRTDLRSRRKRDFLRDFVIEHHAIT